MKKLILVFTITALLVSCLVMQAPVASATEDAGIEYHLYKNGDLMSFGSALGNSPTLKLVITGMLNSFNTSDCVVSVPGATVTPDSTVTLASRESGTYAPDLDVLEVTYTITVTEEKVYQISASVTGSYATLTQSYRYDITPLTFSVSAGSAFLTGSKTLGGKRTVPAFYTNRSLQGATLIAHVDNSACAVPEGSLYASCQTYKADGSTKVGGEEQAFNGGEYQPTFDINIVLSDIPSLYQELQNNGEAVAEITCFDTAGNAAKASYYICYDATAPVPVMTAGTGSSAVITMTATDEGSGIAGYCITDSETPGDTYTKWNGVSPIKKALSGGTWYFHVIDNAGNTAFTSITTEGWLITVLSDENGESEQQTPELAPDNKLYSATVTPSAGYVLDTLTLNGPDHRRAVVLNADGSYTYSFLALCDTKVIATFCPAPALDNFNADKNARLTEDETPSAMEQLYCYGLVDSSVSGDIVVTLGDAIRSACAFRAMYYGNEPVFTVDAASPMEVYSAYANAHGIYLYDDFRDADYAAPATLDQIAYLMSNILVKDAVESRTAVQVDSSSIYYDAVARMMQAGIIAEDADLTANVTMADFADILLRAINPASRL